jgi:hypothetical protein
MMNIEEFRKAYTKTFNTMMQYSPNQVGAIIYTEKLAVLAEEYPEFTEIVEAEE